MVKFQRPAVKAAAQATLSATSSNPRRLVLIHTAATILVSLVLTLIDYLLEEQIGTTGGLGGISTRTTLSTIQTLLRYGLLVVLPIWNCGYLYCCLRLSRQESAGDGDLLSGFRRFGPVLRLTLLKAAIYLLVGLVCAQISSTIFMLTPWASPMLEAMEPMLESGEISQDVLMAAAEAAAVPILVIFGAVFLLACAPVYCALHLTDFCIMDGEPKGALAAILESLRMTRGNRMALLKLDLSFWWFYVLDALVSLLCYGDIILSLLGVPMPWSDTVNAFVCLGAFALAQCLLYTWKKNQVFLTYTHTYNALK